LLAGTAAIDKRVVEPLQEVANKRGLPVSKIALAWMLGNPAITAPIVGAAKMEHLDGAVAALSVTLSKDEIERLEELYQPHVLPEVMSQLMCAISAGSPTPSPRSAPRRGKLKRGEERLTPPARGAAGVGAVEPSIPAPLYLPGVR
jgi:hypothetical protein